MNSLVLAYIGDCVYELYVRKHLISKNIVKINDLQNEAVKYVCAKGQTKHLFDLLDKNFFTDEEKTIINRARNTKGHKSPKNTDIVTYKYATGLEALIGHLYQNNNNIRIDEIMKEILGE